MIYKFIDVNERQLGSCLPDEAIQFNGVWLDEVVPGYRTLQVSGRESITSEIKDTAIDSKDGNVYQSVRYLPRTITVIFQLVARDSLIFRDAFNQLNALLSHRQSEIVFADEADKYFIGTKVGINSIPAGRNAITGEIEFYCADPIKYAVRETVIPADAMGVLEFTYRGSYPAYLMLEAEMTSDNGFVSYNLSTNMSVRSKLLERSNIEDDSLAEMLTSHGSILVGNPDEDDGIIHKYSQTLINDTPVSDVLESWEINTTEPQLSDRYSVIGAVGIIGYTKFTGNVATRSSAAGASDYGDIADSVWHGPTMTRAIPADANEHIGARSFTLKLQNYFIAGDTSDLGVFQLLVSGYLAEEKVVICGITFYRDSTTHDNINGFLMAGGTVVKKFSFDRIRTNNVTGFDADPVEIDKYGSTITFRYANNTYGVELPELSDVEATEVMCFFGQRGKCSTMTNLLESLTFKKHNVDSFEDSPNLFSEGDVVSADCANGNIYVNGLNNDMLGSIDNDWDAFYLRPNERNRIRCSCSGWAEKPKYTIRFREAFV